MKNSKIYWSTKKSATLCAAKAKQKRSKIYYSPNDQRPLWRGFVAAQAISAQAKRTRTVCDKRLVEWQSQSDRSASWNPAIAAHSTALQSQPRRLLLSTLQ